jgi:hypothetical protein
MPTRLATNLGCADNDLVALRRQCFYLAVVIGRLSTVFFGMIVSLD